MLQNCQFENVNKKNQLLSPSLFREACPTDENQKKRDRRTIQKGRNVHDEHSHTHTQASERAKTELREHSLGNLALTNVLRKKKQILEALERSRENTQ